MYGLHLDGARWDEDFLALRDPKIEQKHSMMPSITCKAVQVILSVLRTYAMPCCTIMRVSSADSATMLIYM